MGSGASSSGSAGNQPSPVKDTNEDHSWLLDAVNESWCSPEFQTAVTSFFDEHCNSLSGDGDLNNDEFSLKHYDIFRKYQKLIETRIKDIVEMYGCNVSEMLHSLEKKAQEETKENDQAFQAFIRRLSSYENFTEFTAQMNSHRLSLYHAKSLDSGTNQGNGLIVDQTMGYLAQLAGGGSSGSSGSDGNRGGDGSGSGSGRITNHLNGPRKISSPMITYHADSNTSDVNSSDKQINEFLIEQEKLQQEMKRRQKTCVELAQPMNVKKELLRKLFNYIRDAVLPHNDSPQQHMGVICDILGTSEMNSTIDKTLAIANEMCALAHAQKREESITRRIDKMLPPGSPLNSNVHNNDGHEDMDLARVLEESRQMYSANNQLGSPTTSLIKKAAINSAAQEADRQARLDANEQNYNKTLQEVILRSKIEAETAEANRLRKLMLDTAMAAQLSEKDHLNSALRNKLMALEAELGRLNATSNGNLKELEQTEETLRAELKMKENARKSIQEQMEKFINESEQKTSSLIEEKTKEITKAEEAAKIARESESALRLENSVFKRALEREAKAAEDAKQELNKHHQIAAELREKLAMAQQTQEKLGQNSKAKSIEVENLATLLDTERKRIAFLEFEMKRKSDDNERERELSVMQVKNEQKQQIELYRQQMEELKELRKEDAIRLEEHKIRAEQLQKELKNGELERQRLEQGVEEAKKAVISTESKVANIVESKSAELRTAENINKEREASLASLQKEMQKKEHQLALQLEKIERAKEHESKVQDLQNKLRTELEHKQNLEQRLRDAEESKTAITEETSIKMQELVSAINDARRAAEHTQSEASRELETMRLQLEEERKQHQKQLREAVERELVAVRNETESKVSGLATQARQKENELIAELEQLRTRERMEKEARQLAEEERTKLYAKLNEQNEIAAQQLQLFKQEKAKDAKERDLQSEELARQIKDLERRGKEQVNEMKRQKQEALEEYARRESEKVEQIKHHLMNQLQEQAERATTHENRARELAEALRKQEHERNDAEERMKKELMIARSQTESKVGEVATKARKEELRLMHELEELKKKSNNETSELQDQLDGHLKRLKQLERENIESKSEAQRNERVLWQQQEKTQKLQESLEASKRKHDVQEQRAKELAKTLEEQEKKRWLLESQLNAARAQASSRDQEVAAQVAAAAKEKEDELMKMISESNESAAKLQTELSQAVAAERQQKEIMKEKMQKITEDLMKKVEREEKQRSDLEFKLQAEIKATKEKLTEKSREKQKQLEKQINEANTQLSATKHKLEEQLSMRNKELEDERVVREQIEASLAREEKKRAALKRHLKKKLKDQLQEFEAERKEMTKKYEDALAAARIAEEKQMDQSRNLKESKRARNEIVSLASGQSAATVNKLERELANMRTQLELQRQQTIDARREVQEIQEKQKNKLDKMNVGLHFSSIQSQSTTTPVQLTPRHEKMQKMHIQHEVERETHHERVRQEKARQRAMLKERLERKRGEDRPHSTSMAPGHRPVQVANAWGQRDQEDGGSLNSGNGVEGSGGRGKNTKSFYQSPDGGRKITVRSTRPVVDFTCDDF